MKNLVVLKFGGTSMGDYLSAGKNMPHLINIIKRYQKEYKNVVVVCSALAGETRRFKATAESLDFDNADRDFLLAYGEIISSGILSRFLSKHKIDNEVLNGVNNVLPIITNNVYGKADIKDVDVKAINKVLKKDRVAIIPGFIGKNPKGDVTTLGFDGSDTTAITVASWMKADKVCLFKDVDGIFSANPKKAKARKYDEISHDDMYIFARCGAMIVHPNAIKAAKKSNFDIHILPTFGNGIGSVISAKSPNKDVIGIGYYEDNNGIVTLSVVGNKLGELKDKLVNKFETKGIKAAINNKDSSDKHVDFIIKNKEQLSSAIKIAHFTCGLDEPKFVFVSNLKDKDQISFDPSLKITYDREDCKK